MDFIERMFGIAPGWWGRTDGAGHRTGVCFRSAGCLLAAEGKAEGFVRMAGVSYDVGGC